MYKVSVYKKEKVAFGATFNEIEQANTWIRSQIAKNSWGLPEREVIYHEYEGKHPEAEEIEKYSDGRVRCKVPADYKIVVEEVHGAQPFEEVWKKLRSERDEELLKSDRTQLADFPLDSQEKTYWREYRSYLRDITLQYDNITIYKYNIMDFKTWKMWKYGKE